MLVVDWDAGNVDMKLAVMATEATQNKGYDLTIRGKNVKKTSQLFVPPKKKCRIFDVSRIFELDDVPYGTNLDQMDVIQYELSNARQYTVRGPRMHDGRGRVVRGRKQEENQAACVSEGMEAEVIRKEVKIVVAGN